MTEVPANSRSTSLYSQLFFVPGHLHRLLEYKPRRRLAAQPVPNWMMEATVSTTTAITQAASTV